MGYQNEGDVGMEMIDTSRQAEAEQGYGKRFGGKAGKVFGEVEEEVSGKLDEVGGTQDVGRYAYPAREVNDGIKDFGKEVDT